MKGIIGAMSLTVVLVIVGLLTLCFAWKDNINATENLTVKNDLQKFGVEIISPNNENFNNALTQYVGSYNEVNPLVEAAKPFAVFIQNNSEKEIVGISLRWKFTKFDGKISEVNQIETSPGILMGMKPHDAFMVGKTSLINSNSLKFFSYFPSIGEELLNAFKSNRSKRFVYKLGSEQIQSYTSSIEAQKKLIISDVLNVSVVIDGVIFNDGTFIGENQSFLFESMSGLLQARKNFIKKLRVKNQSLQNDTDNLNESVSDIKSITTESRPTLKYVDGKDAFDQNYNFYMNSLIGEIKGKRLKAKDNYIVKDFLKVKNSDFIDLKRK